MSEEPETELIPEDESVPISHKEENEGISMTEKAEVDVKTEVNSEPEMKYSVSEERIRLENEAYQKHFAALQEEIEEIRKKYPTDASEAELDDPVKRLSGEVNELKNGFGELKDLIQRNQQTVQQQPQQNQLFQQYPPPFQQFFQQPGPCFPPMFQTSTIMPAPPLPFIQTPSFAPANTIPPIIGNNGSFNSNGGK